MWSFAIVVIYVKSWVSFVLESVILKKNEQKTDVVLFHFTLSNFRRKQ